MARTIEEALNQFELINGVGSEESKQACAMTLLAWVAGREWTDSPACAHPVIRNAVIRVNDALSTTPDMRQEIVRAGQDGILDTWWVPRQVIALAFALESKDGPITEFDRLLRALARVAGWKTEKGLPPNLTGAYLAGADLRDADLRGADLTDANLAGAYLAGADLRDADLMGADLTDASLTRAYLTCADLTDANLTDANLTRAYLTCANLTDANLTGAYGTPIGGTPSGWKQDANGRWQRNA